MKKLLLTLLCICGILRADSSDRLAVFFLGGGANGSYAATHITELMPVTYTNTDRITNKMCQSGTCIDRAPGVGLGGEIGVKLRPAKILEIDIWGGMDVSFMLNNRHYPNFIPLKEGAYDYKYPSNSERKYSAIQMTLLHISLNATATLRLGRFGIIGGLGGSIWRQHYGVTLKNQAGDERESGDEIGGMSLNAIGGISLAIGPNRGVSELSLRVVVPISNSKNMTSTQGDVDNLNNNGYVTYKEKIVMQPYMLNLSYRYFF